MDMRSFVVALAFSSSLNAAFASPAAAEGDPRVALKQRATGDTPLMSDLRELCDRIGGRITGTPAAKRAVEWGVEKFRGLGLDSVTTESFAVPFLWLPGTSEVTALAPEPFQVRSIAAPGTASTGSPIEAVLVDVGAGSDADWRRVGTKSVGAIALVHSEEMKTMDDLMGEYFRAKPLLEAASQAHVAGLLVQSTRPRALLYHHPMVFGRKPGSTPVAMISREHANRLARISDHTEVRVRMDVVNRIGPSFDSQNVVAEIKGRENPEEIVLLGAHLDSWALGTGAEDNGVNVALVLDVARAFRALELKPRRTVRFVLFTGEEQGMWGSVGYVQRHKAELGRHVAVVIFDIGSGKTRGFFVNGRPELRPMVARALSVFPGMTPKVHSLEGVDGTDNFDFLLSGVPNLVADQDAAPYLPNYHAESDVVEQVNGREARRNAGLGASLVWWLASTREPLPKQQTRQEVERLLVQTKLVEQMKSFDQWEDWEAGKRGFPAEGR